MKNILLSAFMFVCIFAYSQDTTTYGGIIYIGEVLITGNVKDDPVLSVVKSDFTEKATQPKNSGELFKDINGFSLIKRGNYAVDPTFRSSRYEQLNIQFDGSTKAAHACPNRMDPITTLINPEEITRIEIIKGPFSVRYGNTFAGIINMVTQGKQSRGFHGALSSGYETNGNAFVNLVHLRNTTEKSNLEANFSHRDYNDYKDGDGTKIPSSFRSLGYSVKAGYKINDQNFISAGFRQNFGRDISHAGLMMDTDEDNSSIANLDYRWIINSNVLKNLIFKSYYSYVDHTMSNRHRSNSANTLAISKVNSTTYGGKLETEWSLTKNLKLFLGGDMVNLEREGTRDRYMIAQDKHMYDDIWQDSYISTFGMFAEFKWSLNATSMINLGVRNDFAVSKARKPNETFLGYYPELGKRTESNFSGTISYKNKFSPRYALEVAYGRGTRSANMEERFITFFNIFTDPYSYLGNPNLKAEVNNQFEVGFSGAEKLSGFFNQIKFGSSVYYSIFENYIVGVIDESINSNTKVFRNLDKAYKTGFEVYGELDFAKNFTFLAELSYVYTKNKDLGESLPLTPPLTGRLKLSYDNQKFWGDVAFRMISKQTDIAPSFGETETSGYGILDVKAGLKIIKNLNFGLGVLNVFDKTYHDHLNFSFSNQAEFARTPITEQGRNFTFFASYKF